MKINKVIIKNIQSIKDATIDFDLIENASEGVFLIVGPTGSGKTTILDAITLGLFGNISRLDKVSSSAIAKDGSVVTLGASNASVDIIYTINGSTYHSRWEIKTRPRAGGFDEPKMELRDQLGELIENKLSEVQKKNMEIVGLNAVEFNRTILLAQGDFSAFLKAKFSEKADILEKITGTDIYSRIGRAIFENNRDIESRRKELVNEMARLAILSDEELNEKKITLDSNNEKITVLINKYQLLNEDIARRESYAADTIAQERELKDFESASTTLRELKANFGDAISLLNRVEVGRSHFLKFENAQNIVAECINQQKDIIQLKNVAQGRLEKWVDQMQAVVTGAGTPEQLIQQLGQLREKVNEIQRIIVANNQKLSECQNKVKNNIVKINNPENIVPANEAQWVDFRGFINEQIEGNKIKYNEVVALLNGTEISDAMTEKIYSEINNWTQLKPLIQQFISEQSKQEEYKKKDTLLNEEINHLQQKKNVDWGILQAAKITLTDKKLIFEQNEKIKKLSEHRHDLKDGQPCPLCGALEGPFRKELPPTNNQFAVDFQKAEKIYEEFEQKYRANEGAILIANSKRQDNERLLHQSEVDMNLVKQRIIEIKELLGFDQPIGNKIELIDAQIKSLETKRGYIKKALEWVQQLDQLCLAYEEIKQVIHLQEANKQNKTELEKLYPSEESVDRFFDRMTNEKSAIDLDRASLEARLGDISLRKKEHEFVMVNVKPDLDKLIEDNSLGDYDALKEVFGRESEIRTKARLIAENENLCAGKQEVLNDLANRLHLNQVQINFQITKEEQLLNRNTIDTEKLALSDLNGRIKAEIEFHLKNEATRLKIQQELDEVSKSYEISSKLNALLGSADGAKFKKIAQKNTLYHLTLLANKHLANMSDRYRFDFKADDLWSERDQLDLMVHDLYSNSLRSCATLSGGETFIASLGLALGLSDFASRNNRIDSLFIDEGFGTLDPETLDMAINALERIQQAGGKTICLITHVEAMKERIPYHLRVKKGADGLHKVDFDIAI